MAVIADLHKWRLVPGTAEERGPNSAAALDFMRKESLTPKGQTSNNCLYEGDVSEEDPKHKHRPAMSLQRALGNRCEEKEVWAGEVVEAGSYDAVCVI